MPKVKKNAKNIKDKKVQAFRAVVRTVWGFECQIKEYCHSQESSGIWAYVRRSSSGEQERANAMNRQEDIVLEVAYLAKITDDLMLEFNSKTYKIISIDPYEFNKTDLIIKAKEVPPQIFDDVEYGEF